MQLHEFGAGIEKDSYMSVIGHEGKVTEVVDNYKGNYGGAPCWQVRLAFTPDLEEQPDRHFFASNHLVVNYTSHGFHRWS